MYYKSTIDSLIQEISQINNSDTNTVYLLLIHTQSRLLYDNEFFLNEISVYEKENKFLQEQLHQLKKGIEIFYCKLLMTSQIKFFQSKIKCHNKIQLYLNLKPSSSSSPTTSWNKRSSPPTTSSPSSCKFRNIHPLKHDF